jgi:hypothetical protein
MSDGYIYQTSDRNIVIVVPTLADFDPYAAPRPQWLNDSDFNLTSPALSKTLREMRVAAADAGVRLHKTNVCAFAHNIERIPAVEP